MKYFVMTISKSGRNGTIIGMKPYYGTEFAFVKKLIIATKKGRFVYSLINSIELTKEAYSKIKLMFDDLDEKVLEEL